MFSYEYYKILRNTFFTEHLWTYFISLSNLSIANFVNVNVCWENSEADLGLLQHPRWSALNNGNQSFSDVFRVYQKSSVTWNGLKCTHYFLANIYFFKVNNRNTRKICKTSSMLTIKNSRTSLASFWCPYC